MYIASRNILACCVLVSAMALASRAQEKSQTQPKPRAEVSLGTVTPTSSGLKAQVTVKRASTLNCGVWKHVQPIPNGPSHYEAVTESILVKVPEAARNATSLLLISVSIPPDPAQSYDLNCTASGDQAEDSEMSSSTFHGYSATVANSIKLTFTGAGLQVSAKTKDVVELYVNWQRNENQEVDWSASTKHQDPSLTLAYSEIDASAKKPSETVPVIVALRDSDGVVQEARITLAVETAQSKTDGSTPKPKNGKGQGLQDRIKTIQDPSAKEDKKNKVQFSWKELAVTGLGAVLKYFVLL